MWMESVCELRLGLRSLTSLMKSIVDKTIKISLKLFKDEELAFFEEACLPMDCQKMVNRSQSFYFQQYVDAGVEPT